MQSIVPLLMRRAPVILAGGGLLLLSACSSGPAQLGTPEYALERLFSNRPYRSTDQMFEAYRPRPADPASASAGGVAETPAGEAADLGGERDAGAQAPAQSPTLPPAGITPIVPAAVTIIEVNEWYAVPRGGAYGFPYPYYHYPRAYRPFYHRLYGPGGYPRCFGACGGLSLSIGAPKSRLRLGAGAVQSSSRSTVIAQPPYYARPSLGGPPRRTLTPPPRTLR